MSYRISLVGKVALIVGGSGGIGDASARSFSGCGAHVAVTHRVGADKADAAKQVLNGTAGDGHAAFAADVADTATLLALRDAHYFALWPARHFGQQRRLHDTGAAY